MKTCGVMLLVALAGCQMMAGGHTTTPSTNGPPPPSSGDPSSPPATGEAPAAPGSDGKLVVPNLIGRTLDEARPLVRQAGFKAEIETSRPVECDNAKVPGKIKCQDPDPGQHVATYAMIQVQVYTPDEHTGTLVRDQLAPLIKMSVAKAKAQLAKLGFTGTIKVEAGMQFINGCGFDTVCDVQPESGVSTTGEIVLTVNKRLEISAPPF